MTPDMLATLACQRGPVKRETCVCPPCTARRQLFGCNLPCQLQELRRTAKEKGEIGDLTLVCAEEREWHKERARRAK